MNWGFIFREGVKGLGRNLTMTIALVITTALSLALVGTGALISKATAETKDLYLDRVEVMVELDEDISANDKDCSSDACKQVRDTLQADSEVEQVTFRSREQSYQRFVELFQDSEPELVRETAPDALPAALHVRLKDPTNTAPLDKVRDMPQVAVITDQADTVRSAAGTLNTFRNAAFVVAAAQALAAVETLMAGRTGLGGVPFAEEPKRLVRQLSRMRGQFSSADGLSYENSRRPLSSSWTT